MQVLTEAGAAAVDLAIVHADRQQECKQLPRMPVRDVAWMQQVD